MTLLFPLVIYSNSDYKLEKQDFFYPYFRNLVNNPGLDVRRKIVKRNLIVLIFLVFILPFSCKKKEKLLSVPKGFTYLRTETYTCGGVTNKVKEYRHNATGLEFVLIPGGTFQMGSYEWKNSQPVHTETLKSFLISKTEVTQKVWKKIAGTEPWSNKYCVYEGDDYPAGYISWNDAKSFCRQTELSLPSEAQWEYACRAGTTTRYFWGEREPDIDDYAWYYKNTWEPREFAPHQVAQKKPNAYGLYDMLGNASEWVEDWYHDSYKGAPSDGSARLNKGGDNNDRSCRGGRFLSSPEECRTAFRRRYASNTQISGAGFRVCAPLE